MTEPAKIVALRRPPSDLAAHLREMADLADSGRLTEIIMSYVQDGEYEFRLGASKVQCLAMSSMLHAEALGNMRRHE